MIIALTILRKAWPYLLCTVLVLGAYAWAHHNGVVSQREKDAKVIVALRAQIDTDATLLAQWDSTAKQWKAAQDANDAALRAQQAQGAAALAKAKDDAAQHAKALVNALARQKAAYAGNACAAQPLPEGVQ